MDKLKVVICGSYTKEPQELKKVYRELKKLGAEILSPKDLKFTSNVEGFVLRDEEHGKDPHQIEHLHLRAMEEAELIWFHLPHGHVGVSGAFEMGYAYSLGLPTFSSRKPVDITLRKMITVVPSPKEAYEKAKKKRVVPTKSLSLLQAYYARAASLRGHDKESAIETMLLLTEEVGELARAVRKSAGITRHGKNSNNAHEEIADILLYLLHLSNILEIDLAEATVKKEKENIKKWQNR